MQEKTRRLALAGLITALILLLGLTPLGFPSIPPFSVTIVPIPVALGAMLLGPGYGLFFGLLFGLTSVYQAMISALPTAPIFLDPLVSVLPRLFVPLAGCYAFRITRKFVKREGLIAYAIGGFAASLCNTVLVLTAIYMLHGADFAAAAGIELSTVFGVLVGIGATSLLPEGGLNALFCGVIGRAVAKLPKGA